MNLKQIRKVLSEQEDLLYAHSERLGDKKERLNATIAQVDANLSYIRQAIEALDCAI
jgi:hypothetical protein